jgi:CDP-paratose 2-epimerase
VAEALITGGAGFIGSNLAWRLLQEGHAVTVLDDLSRPGSERNIRWLQDGFAVRFIRGDINQPEALSRAMEGAQRVYHLAGQTAVTASIGDPEADFQANAAGTLRVLEAARRLPDDPVFVYASTNKVYGSLESQRIEERDGRYRLCDYPEGVPETFPLDFHSPYGCSKGAGDQYARDYFRTYGLRTVVLRQSCIYGPRQFGTAGQGWLAWLATCALEGRPIRIFGDGRQVRDVLYIDDLLDAYEAVVRGIDRAAGEVFNVGGGPANAIAVWTDAARLLEEALGCRFTASFGDWRLGDQRVYVSDTRKLRDLTGWAPRIDPARGIRLLAGWLRETREWFAP